MSHTALGRVTNVSSGTTKNKTLTVSTNLAAGTLVVLYWVGYGGTGLALTGVTDSAGNTWSVESEAHDTGAISAAIAYCLLENALPSSGTITLSVTGTHSESAAVARGFTGLTLPIDDFSGDNGYTTVLDGAANLDYPGAARLCAVVGIKNEYTSSNLWSSPLSQVENYMDTSGTVWMLTAGEAARTSAGSTRASLTFPFAVQFAIMSMAFPEGTPPASVELDYTSTVQMVG